MTEEDTAKEAPDSESPAEVPKVSELPSAELEVNKESIVKTIVMIVPV